MENNNSLIKPTQEAQKVFTEICTDFKPNITYVCIGGTYSDYAGPQQHPPFLEKLISEHTDFSFQVIVIDPTTEDPPEFSKTFGGKKIDTDWFGTDRINIHVIREYFNFDLDESNNDLNQSKLLLESLIDRTIENKQIAPDRTYMLFVHDFSGNYIGKFSDRMNDLYRKKDSITFSFYKRTVLIDLNYRLETGCFVNMKDDFFGPALITVNTNGIKSIESLDFFNMTNDELFAQFITEPSFGNYHPLSKKLIQHVLTTRLTEYMLKDVAIFRQVKLFIDGTNKELSVDSFGTGILDSISKNLIVSPNEMKHITDAYVTETMIKRLLIQLNNYCGFFKMFNIYESLFSSFVVSLKDSKTDPYKLSVCFRSCLDDVKKFFVGFNRDAYAEAINKYVDDYIEVNGTVPIFLS